MTPFVKIFLKILSIALVIAGLAGFFVDGYLMGIEVDWVHNAVFIVTGLLGIPASASYGKARSYLILLGFVYGVLAVIGFASGGSIVGLTETNQTGSLTHIVIALICLAMGFGSKKKV